MTVDFYKEFGELGFLANYSSHGFYKNNIYYKTVEHYYQSEKFDDIEIKNKIINCDTPKEASNIGRDRNLIRKDNFRSIKNDVMYEGLYLKFSQNKDIRSKLIETGDSLIREMTVKESYWGVGPNLDGENHIGFLLMKVRDKIKEEVLNNIISNCKDKKVYIIGHHNPDCDSILSAYILSIVLKDLGIDAVAVRRSGEIVDKEVLDYYFGEDLEEIIDYSNKYFILVDNNKLDGIEKNQVIGAIDHHVISGEVEDLIEIEYASCGLLIYDLFKDKFNFTNKLKELIYLTVVFDTEFLNSSRYREYDKKIIESFNSKLNVLELKKKYLKITDFTKNIKDNLYFDYKEYKYNDLNIRRSLIKSTTNLRNKYYNDYISSMKTNNINLIIWCDYDEGKTYINYNGVNLIHPYFTTSTNLILKFLDNNKHL
ncbi:MAG: DUF1768 domain-containing protein [Bacilli bacterium]|nr:DUF1768 domain-containing protein [Bacilli bacterium]